MPTTADPVTHPASPGADRGTTGLNAADPDTANFPGDHPDVDGFDIATGLQNMQQLIQLRWLAVVGQLATIVVVQFGLGIKLPLDLMLQVLICLVAFNVASLLRWRVHRDVSNLQLFIALLVDVATLTVQLDLSGGVSNPFVFLYLLQVILAAVLLDPWSKWTIVAITGCSFAGLTLFSRPLPLPVDFELGMASRYVQGLLVCFAIDSALLVIFITRIERNLRARDARLADLRQHAAEQGHIVRMGLLASGAAHELGTPLATLAVILGDWRRMPPFTADPELLQEVGEMQAQVLRCKTIVSGILMSAGETRSESSTVTTLRAFASGVIAEWQRTRPAAMLTYDDQLGDDLPMVFDSALRQTLFNLLDNASEAAARRIEVVASRDDETLALRVFDDGSGFTPAMLAQLGTPYQSSKGRPGGGLGLFLAVNVARSLGGELEARNRPDGGAVVTLTLPLARILLSGAAHANADRLALAGEGSNQRPRPAGGEDEAKAIAKRPLPPGQSLHVRRRR